MTDWIRGTLDSLGIWAYPVLFLMVFAETGLLIPLPAETALVMAAFLAARGHLSIAVIIVVAAAAAIAGDQVAYQLGRGLGRFRLETRGRFLFLRRKHIEPVARYFARHGGKTVFLGRFVSLLRICAAFFAGMSRMPRRPFLIYNVSGGIVWATAFGLLGYLFGQMWDRIHGWIGWSGVAVVAAIVVAASLVAQWRVRRA